MLGSLKLLLDVTGEAKTAGVSFTELLVILKDELRYYDQKESNCMHKWHYVAPYDINIDGIGGNYWECKKCGEISYEEKK